MFEGSVPEFYERYLVPLIFEPYAADLTARLAQLDPSSVLEIAAGTGVLTRSLAAGLAHGTSITATDLSQPMIDHAADVGTTRPVTWKQADVMDLPFEDESFDVVVCQFGVMFFPDRGSAFAEIKRVLRPNGTFVFNTWDRLGANDFAQVVTDAAAQVFPSDPPRFLPRTPHGYFDHAAIRADLAAGGFAATATIDGLETRSRAKSPDIPAMAYCHGTPLFNEIQDRDPSRLDEVTAAATADIAARFGDKDVDGRINAFIVTASAHQPHPLSP